MNFCAILLTLSATIGASFAAYSCQYNYFTKLCEASGGKILCHYEMIPENYHCVETTAQALPNVIFNDFFEYSQRATNNSSPIDQPLRERIVMVANSCMSSPCDAREDIAVGGCTVFDGHYPVGMNSSMVYRCS